VSSQEGWQDLESAQLQGARRIFGKRSNRTTIGEALRGDLGWQSVKMQVALAKLKFYGHLCRLPDTRLLKRVFNHRRNHYDRVCQALHIEKIKDDSWYSEICYSLGVCAPDWDANHVATLSKRQWETQVEKLINLADSAQLFADFARTNSGLHYGHIRQQAGQETYIWKYDRRSTIIKFALRSRSYKLQAPSHKIGHGLDYKVCRLCNSGQDENEEHHLLSCTAFVPERFVFCDALTQHMQHSFSQEYRDISQAAGPLQNGVSAWSH
jgi:hypothetical protein